MRAFQLASSAVLNSPSTFRYFVYYFAIEALRCLRRCLHVPPRGVDYTYKQGRRQEGGCAPTLELLSPHNNMDLACFSRLWAMFVGRWAIFSYSPQASQNWLLAYDPFCIVSLSDLSSPYVCVWFLIVGCLVFHRRLQYL